MQNEALLATFTEKVDEFERYQGFIEKTKSQAAKFSAKIVEKVVNDNTEKSMNVIMELVPMTADVDAHVASLGTEKESITSANETAQFDVDVLELRKIIGELSDDDFEEQASALLTSLEAVHEKLGVIEGELAAYVSIQERWNTAYEKSGLAG